MLKCIMAYNEHIADRMRDLILQQLDGEDLPEKKMFGGLSFMYSGNMLCGVLQDNGVFRVGPVAYKKAITQNHVRPMSFTGKPMVGYIYVDAEEVDDDVLKEFVQQSIDFVSTLSPK